MAKNKTTQTIASVTDYINSLDDEAKRTDSFRLIQVIEAQTGLQPEMWGGSIIGFGSYHYKYNSGHEGDAPLVGFSPRKAAISLYVTVEPEKREALLQKFGKHKSGKGCIYINKLSDVNLNILQELISESVTYTKSLYPAWLKLQTELKKIYIKNLALIYALAVPLRRPITA